MSSIFLVFYYIDRLQIALPGSHRPRWIFFQVKKTFADPHTFPFYMYMDTDIYKGKGLAQSYSAHGFQSQA